jgi:hypothetical protein
MMVHALTFARKGVSVTIVDRSKEIGGSWATPPAMGFAYVEAGVHLLENRPQFYSVLSQLGIMLREDDRCCALWRGKRYSMGPARALFHAGIAIKALARGRIDRSRRIMASAVRNARYANSPFLYPTIGCRAINLRLAALLKAEGVRLIMGVEIEKISIEPSVAVRCSTSIGEMTFERISIGSRAHAPIEISGKQLNLKLEYDEIRSLLIRGMDSGRDRYSYVEIVSDPVVKRVRDVSAFVAPIRGHEFALSTQLRNLGGQWLAEQGIGSIAKHLGSLGLLSEEAVVTDSAQFDHRQATINDADLRRLEYMSGGCLLGVRTTDFADGFRCHWRHGSVHTGMR